MKCILQKTSPYLPLHSLCLLLTICLLAIPAFSQPGRGGQPQMQMNGQPQLQQQTLERMVNVVHIVKRGETLYNIAEQYNSTIKQLVRWNKMKGKENLNVKPGEKYVVKKIEESRAHAIAKKFKMNVQQRGKYFILIDPLPAAVANQQQPKNTQQVTAIPPTESPKVNSESLTIHSDVDEKLPKSNTVNENAIAVVIGNKAYQNGDVPTVTYALRDAKSVKKYLMEVFGFREGNILYYENATQATFNSVFGNASTHKGKLFNYVKPQASDVFIYYSGHGGPDTDTKEPFFIPTDCDPSLVALNGYSMNTFYRNLSKVPYRSLTVVIDACFSGSSDGGMLLQNLSPVFIKTEETVFNDEKACIFTAAQSDQVASWYPEQGHSLFTYFFLKGLQGAADKDGNSTLTLQELSSYLQQEVPYMARRLHSRDQQPDISGSSNTVITAY